MLLLLLLQTNRWDRNIKKNTDLMDDVLLGTAPKHFCQSLYHWFLVAMEIGLIKNVVPPAFHPVWLHTQKQEQSIQICSKA